jgi:hypothetical protein
MIMIRVTIVKDYLAAGERARNGCAVSMSGGHTPLFYSLLSGRPGPAPNGISATPGRSQSTQRRQESASTASTCGSFPIAPAAVTGTRAASRADSRMAGGSFRRCRRFPAIAAPQQFFRRRVRRDCRRPPASPVTSSRGTPATQGRDNARQRPLPIDRRVHASAGRARRARTEPIPSWHPNQPLDNVSSACLSTLSPLPEDFQRKVPRFRPAADGVALFHEPLPRVIDHVGIAANHDAAALGIEQCAGATLEFTTFQQGRYALIQRSANQLSRHDGYRRQFVSEARACPPPYRHHAAPFEREDALAQLFASLRSVARPALSAPWRSMESTP